MNRLNISRPSLLQRNKAAFWRSVLVNLGKRSLDNQIIHDQATLELLALNSGMS